MNLGFQDFQMAFGRHLRDPHHAARPAGVPARRAAVYSELLFNNVAGFLDACFPVCRSMLGDTRWRRLNRAFFRDWRSHTPWFREIPREFVRYLQEGTVRQPLPAWFAELAHYEWAELAMDIADGLAPPSAEGDLLSGQPVLNPAAMSVAYAWPVHRIGPAFRPRRPVATHLVIYRDSDDEVAFAEINPVTARLLALIAEGGCTGSDACRRIAGELGHADAEVVLTHGAALLVELQSLGIILGVKP